MWDSALKDTSCVNLRLSLNHEVSLTLTHNLATPPSSHDNFLHLQDFGFAILILAHVWFILWSGWPMQRRRYVYKIFFDVLNVWPSLKEYLYETFMLPFKLASHTYQSLDSTSPGGTNHAGSGMSILYLNLHKPWWRNYISVLLKPWRHIPRQHNNISLA